MQSRSLGYFFLLTFLLLFTQVWTIDAQTTIRGKVLDSMNNELVGSTVGLAPIADSNLETFTICDEQGNFSLFTRGTGAFTLQISFIGYGSFQRQLNLQEGQDLLDLGVIVLKADGVLLEMTTIQSDALPILINKDTLQFNVSAFNVDQHEAVEDLLRKLPGLEILEDGTILVNGKEIKKITVDGQEFFGGNLSAALEILPAKAIEKVQVYEKNKKLSERAGGGDPKEQILNLGLTEEAKKAWIGDLSAGYGYEDRYESRVNLHSFKNKWQVSVLAGANNVNQQPFRMWEYFNNVGGMLGYNLGLGAQGHFSMSGASVPQIFGYRKGGERETQMLGLNLGYDNQKTLKGTLNFMGNRLERLRMENEYGTFLQNRSGQSFLQLKDENETGIEFSHQANIDFSPDSLKEFNIAWAYLNGDVEDHTALSDSLFMDSSATPLSSSSSEGKTEESRESFILKSGATWTLNALGRTNGIYFTYATENGQEFLNSELSGFSTGPSGLIAESADKIWFQKDRRETLTATWDWKEPLIGDHGIRLSAQIAIQESEVSQVFLLRDDSTSIWIAQEDGNGALSRTHKPLSALLAYEFSNDTTSIKIGITGQRNAIKQHLNGNEVNFDISKNFFSPFASFWIRGSSGRLYANYERNLNVPYILENLPLLQNTTQTLQRRGNLALGNYFEHKLYGHFSWSKSDRSVSYWAYAYVSYAEQTKLDTRTTLSDGSSLAIPSLADEDALFLDFTFSRNWALKKLPLRMGLRASFDYEEDWVSHNDDFLKTHTESYRLGLNFRDKEAKKLNWRVAFRYNLSQRSNNGLFEDFNYSNPSLSLRLSYKWTDYKLSTNYYHEKYIGEFDELEDVHSWNADFFASPFKNKGISFTIKARDLLNRNLSQSRYSSEQRVSVTEYNNLKFHILFGLKYNLSGKPDTDSGNRYWRMRSH